MSSDILAPGAGAAAADADRTGRILNAIPQMVWTARPDGHHDFYNDRWYEFTGAPHGSTDGEGWNGMFHAEDQAQAWERWRHSLATGEAYEIQYRLRHHSGAYRWTLGRAIAVRDSEGRIERWFGTCTDIHDLKMAEAEAHKLAAIVEQSADLIGVIGDDLRFEYLNPAGCELAGIAAADARGARLDDHLAPPSRNVLHQLVLPRVASRGRWEGEMDLRPAGAAETLPVMLNIIPVRDAAGKPVGYAATIRDLRERERYAEALELIARELSHRIKNIFSVVTSLVTLSARGEPAAQGFAEGVQARIEALARAHEYVRPHSPDQPAESAAQTLQGLLRTLFAPYQVDGEQRIQIRGDDTPVGAGPATSLALVFHELATNAVKYGALSNRTGCVDIHCRTGEDDIVITWREAGGPPLAGPPDRQGFGARMSARVVAAQLEATMVHDWAPGGLSVRLTAPLRIVGRP